MHHVSRDQFRQGNFLGFTIPDNGGVNANHGLKLGRGVVSPGFLDKPQYHAQEHHDRHHCRSPQIAGKG